MNEYSEEDILLKEMMKAEAKLKQTEAAIKASEKKMAEIRKSNTWKATNKLSRLFKRSADREEIQAKLELELLQLKNEVVDLSDTLDFLQLQQETYDYDRIWRMVREKKDAGEAAELLEQLIERQKIANDNYKKVLHAAGRLFMKEKEAYRKLIYPIVFEGLPAEDIPEFMVRSGFSEDKISLKAAASFRASLTMRMREYQLHGSLPEMILDDKKQAYQFAEALGIRTPRVSEQTYTYDDIPEEAGIAIKPVDGAGARGVYLVYANDDIIDIKQSKKIANWQVLRKDMERDLIAGRVLQDDWFTEELILEDRSRKTPARDIKFYCFYGKAALILEIVRYPEIQYCWWTRDGERVATGKYEDSLFKGHGVRDEEIKRAEAISAEIPAPFIRIDFLRSDNGLVFGEFTPKPGNYDEFDTPTDRWLGDYFLDAQGRLAADLLNGKEFLQFKNLTSE